MEKREILVIDDNRCLREELVGLLMDEGYPVRGVEGGAQALAWLRCGGAPGLILLDIHMPGLDGFALYGVLQADSRLSQIPVVVVSTERGGQKEALRHQARAWLEKPFPIEDLLALVAQYCAPTAEDSHAGASH